MSRIISANRTAKILGVTPQLVRERLKRGVWAFGRAIPPSESGKQHWTYEVYVPQLMRYLGER